MSENANAHLSYLYELNQGIVSFRNNFNNIRDDIESLIREYFAHFQRQSLILKKRLTEAENALVSAENELREQRSKRRPVRNDDGEIDWEPVDCSAQENKVNICLRRRDFCREQLEKCKKIINSCSVLRNFGNGAYNVIDSGVCLAIKKLDQHINDINDYQGNSNYINTEATRYKDIPREGIVDPPIIINKTIRHVFYGNNGEPMQNVKITIVDNRVFGFGQIDVYTDENGQAIFPYQESDDCSIYIDNEEIYSGHLFESMEYNKYKDGAFVSTIGEKNNDKETSRVRFEALENDEIDVTHSLNIDKCSNQNIRREETFVRDGAEASLSELKIEVVSDDKKNEVKDGWIKVIKEEDDGQLL